MDDSFRELLSVIREKAVNRLALIISADDIKLNSEEATNRIYVLELGISNAAGGRAGGFGQRSIMRVCCFLLNKGICKKELDVSGSQLEGFEPPYHATSIPIILEDGGEVFVAGVVDQDLVSQYNKVFARFGSG